VSGERNVAAPKSIEEGTMKKMMLLALVILAPEILFAQSAFDGTWRFNLGDAQFGGKEEFLLANGVYRCGTCDPKIEAKADGQDHKVSDSPYFDAISVRAVSDKAIEIVNKKGGKVVGTMKRTASGDGNTLTTEWSSLTNNGQPASGKYNSARVGPAPGGAHKLSGSWRPEKVESASENVMTVGFKETDDSLSMTQPTGEAYSAKFDGKDYPYKGDPGLTSVSLNKIDANTIEETDKRDGKAIAVVLMTVAPDGKTMTFSFESKLNSQTAKWTAQKQ
jgi:hypothetical protein